MWHEVGQRAAIRRKRLYIAGLGPTRAEFIAPGRRFYCPSLAPMAQYLCHEHLAQGSSAQRGDPGMVVRELAMRGSFSEIFRRAAVLALVVGFAPRASAADPK